MHFFYPGRGSEGFATVAFGDNANVCMRQLKCSSGRLKDESGGDTVLNLDGYIVQDLLKICPCSSESENHYEETCIQGDKKCCMYLIREWESERGFLWLV